MRYGRLAVRSDGLGFARTEILVVPDDGSEPIALRCVAAVVEGGVGEVTQAKVTAACTEINLAAHERERAVHISGKAAEPPRPLLASGISVQDMSTGEPIVAQRFVWVFSGFMKRAHFYLKGER